MADKAMPRLWVLTDKCRAADQWLKKCWADLDKARADFKSPGNRARWQEATLLVTSAHTTARDAWRDLADYIASDDYASGRER